MDSKGRFILSIGWMINRIAEPSNDRINRLGRKGDSTFVFSIFADRSPSNNSIAHAPVILANFLLYENQRETFGVGFNPGILLWEVDQGSSPEYVAGLCYAINHRLILTPIALHYGRIERLLLGNVADQEVPSEITSADAVGTAWRAALTASISLKIQ